MSAPSVSAVGVAKPSPTPSVIRSARSGGVVCAAALFGLWSGLFALLASTLPLSPLLRIRTDEPIGVQKVTDDSSTVVATTTRARTESSRVEVYDTFPIRLLDLRTGQERKVGGSDESEPSGEIRDFEAGERYQIAGNQTVGEVLTSGDHVAVVVVSLDESDQKSRVHVINWRTAETVLDVANEGVRRLESNALLMEVVEEGTVGGSETDDEESDEAAKPRRSESRRRTKIWDLRTGALLPDIWGEELKAFKLFGIEISADNRWLVSWMFDSLRVWDLERRRKHIDLPGEKGGAVAISSDGRFLAIARLWNPAGPEQFTRQWLLFDLPAGRAIREGLETIRLATAEDQLLGSGTLAFVDGGRTIRCRHPNVVTDWTESGFRQVEGSEESIQRIGKKLEGDRPRLCSTGAPPAILGVSAEERWAVTRPEPKSSSGFPFVRQVREILTPVLGDRSARGLGYRLWQLPEGVPVATLGRGTTEECWFTPDGTKAITQSDRELLVWVLPPSRPWRGALLGSLAVPVIALVLALRKRLGGVTPR